MKKLFTSITAFFVVTCCLIGYTHAVDEYAFDLQYQGTITKNIEKSAVVLLTGVNGTPHTNVQIKVDITGPATPELLATDSYGNEINIAQVGYWGPPAGFAVGGSFINNTAIKATFPEEGDYTITLSLVDLANNNTVITTKAFNIQVFEEASPIIPENTVEELPKTGTSIWEYLLYVMGLTIMLSIIGLYYRSRKLNQ